MKNFNSDVVVDFTFVDEGELNLIGFYMDVNLSDENIQQKVNSKAEAFLQSVKPKDEYNAFSVYFQRFDEKKSECIPAFFGIDLKLENQDTAPGAFIVGM